MDPTAKPDNTQPNTPAPLAGDVPVMTAPADMSTVPPPPTVDDSSPFGGSAPVADTATTTETPSEPEPFTVSAGGGGGRLNKKVVGGILGVLVLVAAVGAGLALVQQQQLFQQGAYDGSDPSCDGTYPSCQTEGGQNTGYICQCLDLSTSGNPRYVTNCATYNPSSCPTTPVDNCPNGQYFSGGCGQDGCSSDRKPAYTCDSATGSTVKTGCQLDVTCTGAPTPTPVPPGLIGVGQSCGTMESNGTWTIQGCASGLACSWYQYNHPSCATGGYPIRCFSINACVLTLGNCPRPGTNSNNPPRCVATADSEPPEAGTNACAGSCCTANTDAGFSVQKWTCPTFLQDGRCTAATGGTLVSTSGQECYDSNFCGSQQIDVVNSDGVQQANLAIAQNGSNECGEEPTPTPSGDTATPTPSGSETSIVAQCTAITAYDSAGAVLSATDLAGLSAGEIVRFAVNGSTTSGNLDQARFTINGVAGTAVTQRDANGKLYTDYTIPEGVTSFTISAELHHTDATIGWF